MPKQTVIPIGLTQHHDHITPVHLHVDFKMFLLTFKVLNLLALK